MRKIALLGLLMTISLSIRAQMFSASFVYDANGNRTQATVIYLLKSAPVEDDEFFEERIEEELSLRLYPNPTKGLIRIELHGNTGDVEKSKQNRISVYDLSGKPILIITPVRISNEIDLSNNPDGVYIIRVDAGEITKTYKVIKQ